MILLIAYQSQYQCAQLLGQFINWGSISGPGQWRAQSHWDTNPRHWQHLVASVMATAPLATVGYISSKTTAATAPLATRSYTGSMATLATALLATHSYISSTATLATQSHWQHSATPVARPHWPLSHWRHSATSVARPHWPHSLIGNTQLRW